MLFPASVTLFMRTPVIGLRGPTNPSELILTCILIIFAKILLPNKVIFTSSGVRTWTYLMGDRVQPLQKLSIGPHIPLPLCQIMCERAPELSLLIFFMYIHSLSNLTYVGNALYMQMICEFVSLALLSPLICKFLYPISLTYLIGLNKLTMSKTKL